ncbi:MAG: sulfurtransferase TusA family protein [Armatimonadetes bacterium]|nr:sulfurtransferase TusA family protein [Armatimonadota bacterium]
MIEARIPCHDTLDTLGLYCPIPVLKLAKKIKDIEVGQVLEVVSDDSGCRRNIPNWCRVVGHEYLGAFQEEGLFRVYVRRLK